MALKPQSIRSSVKIWINGKRVGEEVLKDELIILSETWEDKQENFFRKMLKQGGTFNIGQNQFEIKVPGPIYTSKGDIDPGIVKVPGEEGAF